MTARTTTQGEGAPESRLTLDLELAGQNRSSLRSDALEGLTAEAKSLPAKHFYDARGSALFDAICDTPEYYPTRTEDALLEAVAGELMAAVRPTHLVELGSGASRKTRRLLEAMHSTCGGGTFVPLDVSASMLKASAQTLLSDYPWLRVHGVVGDYAHTLARVPKGPRRLFAFLGSTIGNFSEAAGVAFLGQLRAAMGPEDALLLGTDLVKSPELLHAAYNDEQGLTADFNKNLLHVLNRELGADFDPERFEHVAFFSPSRTRVEMHLKAREAHEVEIEGLGGVTIPFEAGETIHTEISRKFTQESAREMLSEAGFILGSWYVDPSRYFALSLSRPS